MPSNKSPLRRVIKRHIPQICLSILVDAVSNFSYSLIPALTAILIDRVLIGGDLSLMKIAVYYAVLLFGYLAFGYLSQVIAWNYFVGFERDAKNAYFYSLMRDRRIEAKGEESGSVLSQLTNNVTKIEQDFITPCVAIVKDFVALLLYATVLFIVSTPTITVTLFLASLCLLLLPRLVRRNLSDKANNYLGTLATYTARAEELIRARFDVPYQSGRALDAEHGRNSQKTAESRKKWGIFKATSDVLAGTATEILLFVAFILAGIFAMRGEISIGVVAATVGYSQAFLSPLEDILYCFNAINSTTEIRKKFNVTVSSTQRSITATPESLTEVKSFKAVNLPTKPTQFPSYQDYPRVTIELSQGEKLYIRGKSGTGKTTIMRAVAFGRVDDAMFYYDSMPFEHNNGKDVFAYVGATSPVFHATFEENITLFGAFSWDAEKLRLLSGKTGFLERLCDRVDMTTASGGEKQFMLLARAVLQNPAFYVLDEPTSAMDSATQECVLKYFSSIPEGVILSTHQENAIPDVAKWKVLDLNALN